MWRGGAQGGGCLGGSACSPSFLLQSGAMGGKPLSTFYTQLVLMPQVLHYAQYVLLGLGGLLLLVPIIYQLRSQVSRRCGQARDSAQVSAGLSPAASSRSTSSLASCSSFFSTSPERPRTLPGGGWAKTGTQSFGQQVGATWCPLWGMPAEGGGGGPAEGLAG